MNAAGPLYALMSFGIFATHDVVVKHLGATYSPFQIIFFSTIFSFPLATFMLMRDRTEGHLKPIHPWWNLLRMLSTVVSGFTAFYAFSVLPLAQVYVMIFATPLLVTLLSIPVLGEKVGIHRLLAVLVGFVGVIVALNPASTKLGLGHAAGIAQAVFGATASIVVRKIGREERTVVLMLYPLAANFVIMGVLMAFVYKPMPLPDLGSAGIIALFSFVASMLLIFAYRKADAVIVAPMQYSQLIWAIGYGYFLFDESVAPSTLIGGAIIIASGSYIVFRETRLGAKSKRPVLRTRSRGPTAATIRISPMLHREEERDAVREETRD